MCLIGELTCLPTITVANNISIYYWLKLLLFMIRSNLDASSDGCPSVSNEVMRKSESIANTGPLAAPSLFVQNPQSKTERPESPGKRSKEKPQWDHLFETMENMMKAQEDRMNRRFETVMEVLNRKGQHVSQKSERTSGRTKASTNDVLTYSNDSRLEDRGIRMDLSVGKCLIYWRSGGFPNAYLSLDDRISEFANWKGESGQVVLDELFYKVSIFVNLNGGNVNAFSRLILDLLCKPLREELEQEIVRLNNDQHVDFYRHYTPLYIYDHLSCKFSDKTSIVEEVMDPKKWLQSNLTMKQYSNLWDRFKLKFREQEKDLFFENLNPLCKCKWNEIILRKSHRLKSLSNGEKRDFLVERIQDWEESYLNSYQISPNGILLGQYSMLEDCMEDIWRGRSIRYPEIKNICYPAVMDLQTRSDKFWTHAKAHTLKAAQWHSKNVSSNSTNRQWWKSVDQQQSKEQTDSGKKWQPKCTTKGQEGHSDSWNQTKDSKGYEHHSKSWHPNKSNKTEGAKRAVKRKVVCFRCGGDHFVKDCSEPVKKVNIEDLYVNDSDQVWKFKGTALKRGKGKRLQSQKVGICPFCVKNAVKLRDAKEDRIRSESSEESEIRTKMHKGRDRETILYNLKLIASYCLKYVRSSKNIRNYLDLYPVLWNSSGGGSLLYTSVDQAALSEQGQYVDKDTTCTSPHKEKGKDISAIINTLTRKRQTAEYSGSKVRKRSKRFPQ